MPELKGRFRGLERWKAVENLGLARELHDAKPGRTEISQLAIGHLVGPPTRLLPWLAGGLVSAEFDCTQAISETPTFPNKREAFDGESRF